MTADVSPRHLEYLVAVADTGSMSAAAVQVPDVDLDESGLSCTTVRASRPCAILAPGHPLAGRDAVSLADEPLIVHAASPAPTHGLVARGPGCSTRVQRRPNTTSFEALPPASVPRSDLTLPTTVTP